MFRLNRPTSPTLDSTGNGTGDTSSCRQQALARSQNKLSRHHPNVKLPPRLEEKPKEEQIRRCCDRMKAYPNAVDTLTRTLSTIISHPSEAKYRRVDQTNPGYQRSLAKAPGAEQLLQVLGFVPTNMQTLILARMDCKLVIMALSALEKTRETREYQQAKKHLMFARKMTNHLQTTPSQEEQTKRNEFLAMLPKEPSPGQSAVIMIQLGDDNSTTLKRRFDGDDTFQDVLNWIAGEAGTIFLDKLLTSREWYLIDVNRQGRVPIDCEISRHNTIQYLGFWPSGRLVVCPSSEGWVQATARTMEIGPSRGLGSAANEML